jgi:putative endonuclease
MWASRTIWRRIYEHKEQLTKGFASKYGVTRLVWYETHEQITEAIAREKELKKWRRDRKIRLIEGMNSEWEDLYLTLNQ